MVVKLTYISALQWECGSHALNFLIELEVIVIFIEIHVADNF